MNGARLMPTDPASGMDSGKSALGDRQSARDFGRRGSRRRGLEIGDLRLLAGFPDADHDDGDGAVIRRGVHHGRSFSAGSTPGAGRRRLRTLFGDDRMDLGVSECKIANALTETAFPSWSWRQIALPAILLDQTALPAGLWV